MSASRSVVCPFGCGGKVSVPKGRRNLTLDQVLEHHKPTCPAVIKIKERKHDESAIPD